ncbi:MAG TPA: hypothetical protein VN980_18215 [Alphaproteobacteria bacterium]|nr:hypothetical protein [Alphaproteobacteria bacterium]
MIRIILALLIAAFLAAPLAGCGRKGPPEVPKGDTNTLDRKYPKPHD